LSQQEHGCQQGKHVREWATQGIHKMGEKKGCDAGDVVFPTEKTSNDGRIIFGGQEF